MEVGRVPDVGWHFPLHFLRRKGDEDERAAP